MQRGSAHALQNLHFAEHAPNHTKKPTYFRTMKTTLSLLFAYCAAAAFGVCFVQTAVENSLQSHSGTQNYVRVIRWWNYYRGHWLSLNFWDQLITGVQELKQFTNATVRKLSLLRYLGIILSTVWKTLRLPHLLCCSLGRSKIIIKWFWSLVVSIMIIIILLPQPLQYPRPNRRAFSYAWNLY